MLIILLFNIVAFTAKEVTGYQYGEIPNQDQYELIKKNGNNFSAITHIECYMDVDDDNDKYIHKGFSDTIVTIPNVNSYFSKTNVLIKLLKNNKFIIEIKSNYYYEENYSCSMYKLARILIEKMILNENTYIYISSILLKDHTQFGLLEWQQKFNIIKINKEDNMYVKFYNETHIGVIYTYHRYLPAMIQYLLIDKHIEL